MSAARKTISRRSLLIGGGAGVGLVLAWAVWPRRYLPGLAAAANERVFNAFLKIGTDGRVIVAVPQAELGQGSWTALPQILADELGADWRTVGVEAAPIGPLYANALLAATGTDAPLAERAGRWRERRLAGREGLMLTGGSTSVRAFERPLRDAGAAARALLMKAAARRWQVEWDTLDTVAGFVGDGRRRLSFAELAEDAAAEEPADFPPIRAGIANRLTGEPLPRLDLPSKVDGSATYAGDVRLAGMVYASVRSGPTEDSALSRMDKRAGLKVPGVVGIFDAPGWVAAVASNWWAADRAVRALEPVWNVPHPPVSSRSIDEALAAGLRSGTAVRVFERGDLGDSFASGSVLRGHYAVGPAPTAAMETLSATARYSGGELEIWAATQAPALARAAAARVAALSEDRVTLYPTFAGGGYGRRIETRAIEQAAMLAVRVRRPVQLSWSRLEETVQDSFRPPARGEILARLGEGGMIAAWHARIAAADGGKELARRLRGGSALAGLAEPAAGAVPPYAVPVLAVDLLRAETGFRAGLWRSSAHSYTAFFTESFVDELARLAGMEPFGYRMQMLGSSPRLARCLQTATTLGGWDGGGPGSAMGIACHSAFGSHIAALVEVDAAGPRPRLLRAVCAVDVGRAVNPELVRQQIEGGLLFGAAAATGAPVEIASGRPTARGFADLGLTGLADAPEVSVEIIESDEDPGGATELAVPVAAPAIANALHSLTGRRLRSLPLSLA